MLADQVRNRRRLSAEEEGRGNREHDDAAVQERQRQKAKRVAKRKERHDHEAHEVAAQHQFAPIQAIR